MMKKGNRLEVDKVEELRLTRQLFIISARKEVKNSKSLVKNFVNGFEDRFIGVVNFKDPDVPEQPD